MKVIAIYNESQDVGKTFAALNLANAFSSFGGADDGKVCLIDADDTNETAGTSHTILCRKPLRKRGFDYFLAAECDLVDSYNYVIIDTSRSPKAVTKDLIKASCDLVIVPAVFTEKSIQSTADSINYIRHGLDLPVALLPIDQSTGGADKVIAQFKYERHVEFLPKLPYWQELKEMLEKGDLSNDVGRHLMNEGIVFNRNLINIKDLVVKLLLDNEQE